jgi:hypothetical protein
MKKVTLSLATVSLVALFAGTASAQCAFDIVPAKGVKGSFVRNYAPCPSTETGGVPNAETEGDTAACTPVTPREVDGASTEYSFTADGGCSIQTQAKLVKACEKVKGADGNTFEDITPGPCHVTYVKGKCFGIQDGTNTLIGDGDAGWKFFTLSRASLDDDSNGDMTVIDFPVSFSFGVPKDGGMKIKANSVEALAPLVGAQNSDLPDCTSIEIVDVTVKDPLLLPFAKLGGATIPEAP